jgi:hypothetical protein
MNAVEIEEALSELALQHFDPQEFPYAFLAAFGNKDTTLKRLRKGDTNASDIPGALLQRNHIHVVVAALGEVGSALNALRASPKTAQAKARFILATDGVALEAEELASGDALACEYPRFPDYFGFFLPLAGISTIKEIQDNPIDVRATGRLNKLYVELLRENPEWATESRRADMNHFMARLIFCFFAEDTDIFHGDGLFTRTVDQMSERDGSNTHEVLATLFRTMNLTDEDRRAAKLPRWAEAFPHVNGGLFGGAAEAPRFTRTARSYLFQAGQLNWKAINPDIFGSMIQAVADDKERGALGLHYTSVPNILKVLNPLFLDDLRAQLEAGGDNKAKLLNLRKRMARIRVFDPACGSGNFLVIAYKEMRAIEAKINRHRGDPDRQSEIPLTNFRGIELRDFPAEIARLALIIAEFQCDVLYRGQLEALRDVLPLDSESWITCGNALRLDWLTVCPPTGPGVRLVGDDLFNTPLTQPEIEFENEGGETYVCGNPPYKGRNKQTELEKSDTAGVFAEYQGSYASLDYVANWVIKAAQYCEATGGEAGLVATNSICQGEQVALLWPLVFGHGVRITFAHTSFKWSNLASNKAGVTVIVIGLSSGKRSPCTLYSESEVRQVDLIGPYLVPNTAVVVTARTEPISELGMMYLGNMAKDGGYLLFSKDEGRRMVAEMGVNASLIREFYGSEELIHSRPRACLWIEDASLRTAMENATVSAILERITRFRASSKAPSTRAHASTPHRFVQMSAKNGERAIIVPAISSENRVYLPVDYSEAGPVISHKCYALYDEPIWNLALVASRMHVVWIGTVCSRLEMRFSYGNKIGWNTFPVPTLTEQNKAELTRHAEDILLAREAHFPATIGDLYDPDTMPEDLRRAHEQNDEVVERIYIGRRFRNDTERLEKLFEMYAKMLAERGKKPAKARRET